MKQYTAVIFDLDGTLLDTLDDLTDAVNDALRKNGFQTETGERVCKALGNGIVSLFEAFVPHGQQNERFDRCLDQFRAVYPKMSQNHTRPYAGIPEMLSVLHENGIFTAVVSNKFHAAATALVAHYFPSVSCSMGEQESIGIRRKPAPDMIHRILQQYGIPAEACLYVGDSEVDIETAANAGIDCVSVTWGLRDRAFLQDCGAKLLIHTPDALTDYLLQHITPNRTKNTKETEADPMERKVALQIQHDNQWENMLEITAANGFRYVSMGFGSSKCFHSDDWEAEIQRIRQKLDALGLRCIMTHAPYYDLRISADVLDDAMETALLRCVQATAALGGEIMAIHPRGYYRDENPAPENGFYGNGIEKPELSYLHNIKNLRPLVQEAIRCGCRIGVENLPVFPGWTMTFCSHDPKIHKRLIDDLDPAGVCGVWDFGHAYLTHEDSASVLATFGSRICGTHVHDNDRQGDDHRTPFFGTIDWEKEMAALRANHYSGYLTMELVYDHLYGNTEELCAFVRTAYENCCKLEEMMA